MKILAHFENFILCSTVFHQYAITEIIDLSNELFIKIILTPNFNSKQVGVINEPCFSCAAINNWHQKLNQLF